MLDVYTKQPIVNASLEHIVHNALGGRWTAPLLNKTTNDVLGSTIDAGLADALLIVRVMLDAKSGDGKSPPPLRGTVTEDGRHFTLLPRGKPELAAPRVTFNVDDTTGKVVMHGTTRSMDELRRLTSRKLAKYGVPPEVLEAGATAVRQYVPRVAREVAFGPPVWRACAKMLCNLLAVHDRDLFLTDDFNPIRAFVLSGGDPWDFVALNTSPVALGTSDAMGELDHLLVVHGDERTGMIRGFLALYGHFQIVVDIGRGPVRRTFTTAYRVDQLGGRDRLDAPADLSVPLPPFVRLTEDRQQIWFGAMQAAMEAIMKVAARTSERYAVEDLVSDCMDDILGSPDGGVVSPEQIERLAREVAERFVTMMAAHGRFDGAPK